MKYNIKDKVILITSNGCLDSEVMDIKDDKILVNTYLDNNRTTTIWVEEYNIRYPFPNYKMITEALQ